MSAAGCWWPLPPRSPSELRCGLAARGTESTKLRSRWCSVARGNILDRVRHGYVVDFADLHFGDFRPFLVFNVGDAAISIAVAILFAAPS